MNENTTFDSSDLRNTLPRFTPEARKVNRALVDLLGRSQKKERDACSGCAGMVAEAKPWIVPIPGTTKTGAAGREC
jgi:hypothetical protein